MTRSGPLLARRRLEPTWLNHPVYVETYGPEVRDICGTANFEPDPEQELILDLVFAIGPNGKSAAFEVDIIGPRQMFKTGVLKQIELGWLFVTEERLIVHSAHELSTTEEAFSELRNLIENAPVLAKHLDPNIGDHETPGILGGNGRWSIHLAGGQRVKYKARTKSGGRGLTGNKVVMDEGFAVTPKHVGSLYPTLTAVPDPQVITASSAGMLDSEVLREKRLRGRAGSSPRQIYIEYGDVGPGGCKAERCDHAKTVKGCALDDEKRWRKFMTQLRPGGRVDIQTIREMRSSMPPHEFAREFMVWWEDPPTDGARGKIDLKAWAALANPAADLESRPAISVEVSLDREWSTIGVAGASDDKTLTFVQSRRGMGWVVAEVIRLTDKHNPVEIALDPSGPAGSLLADLEATGNEIKTFTARDMAQACGNFQNIVTEQTLVHLGQAQLDTAVKSAITKDVGDAEKWDRREGGADISPLVAASIACFSYARSENGPSVYEARGLVTL